MRHLTMCTWEQVPHLSPEVRAEYLASIPPHERQSRTTGIPSFGAGAVFPIAESEVVVDDILLKEAGKLPIPHFWPRAFGMDVGWNKTAVVWGARDPETKIIYLYSEHYVGRQEPSLQAAAIRGRGEWIPGLIDPAARGRSQKDGAQLLHDYRDLGLKVQEAVNAVDAGIFQVWELLSSGMLKVLGSLHNWRAEFRLYRRDAKGYIVKPDPQSDQPSNHLMDATRYLIVGRDRMITRPAPRTVAAPRPPSGDRGWMS